MLNKLFGLFIAGIISITVAGIMFLLFIMICDFFIRFCEKKSKYSFVAGCDYSCTGDMLYINNIPTPCKITNIHYWLAVWSGAKYVIPIIFNVLIIILCIGFIVVTIGNFV